MFPFRLSLFLSQLDMLRVSSLSSRRLSRREGRLLRSERLSSLLNISAPFQLGHDSIRCSECSSIVSVQGRDEEYSSHSDDRSFVSLSLFSLEECLSFSQIVLARHVTSADVRSATPSTLPRIFHVMYELGSVRSFSLLESPLCVVIFLRLRDSFLLRTLPLLVATALWI